MCKKYPDFCAVPSMAKRMHEEDEHEYRNSFQRDRDRIMYSKEFRRLSGKTQVFNAGFDDNTRTRLTHTLEVAQIARTICDALGLNSTLAEAIAYGHDVGHTPFGHVGERTLNYIMNSCLTYYDYKNLSADESGFKHNLQSLKVLTELEKISEEYPGLNLTRETLWGVVNHSKLKYKKCDYLKEDGTCQFKSQFKRQSDKEKEICKIPPEEQLGYYSQYLSKLNDEKDWSIEGIIVSLADEISQRHHDIEDGMYAGIIQREEIEERISNYIQEYEKTEVKKEQYKRDLIIGRISKAIINYYCSECIDQIGNVLSEFAEEYDIKNCQDFYMRKSKIYNDHLGGENSIINIFGFRGELKQADEELKKYLEDKMLQSELAQTMDGKAAFIIRRLFKAYLRNPQQLPDKTLMQIYKTYSKENEKDNMGEIRRILDEKLREDSIEIKKTLMRKICDYIAGMTDEYAMLQYNKLYGTDIIKKSLI